MKIVVLGGSGLIGTKVVKRLRDAGHDVLAASPSTGVNAVTGEGLASALRGAEIVVDVANSPSFEPEAALTFFQRSAANLLPAEEAAGVKHHVALSVVGAERLPDLGYMRAKLAQEAAIRAAKVPYTIVRATQFHEFVPAIASSAEVDGVVRVPSALVQTIAAEDVARLLVGVALEPARSGMVEIGGPEAIPLDAAVRRLFAARKDPRTVVTDERATYFGAPLETRTLVPGEGARLGAVRFDELLREP